MQIVVIGSGITGLTTASALVDVGHEVILVDRAFDVAQGASRQNGAQLSYAFVAPLASPATLLSIPAMLLDKRAPLHVSPAAVLRDWRWCFDFVRACRHRQVARTTHELLALSERSRERLKTWLQYVDPASIDFVENGKLVLCRTAEAWRAACRQVDLQAAEGPPQLLYSPDRCRELEPSLRFDEMPLVGGIYTPTEQVADCRKVCEALMRQLTRSRKFTSFSCVRAFDWVRVDRRIRAVRAHDHNGEEISLRADAFVVCAGIGSPRLVAPLGIRLPIVPLKGYSIEIKAAALRTMPSLSITDTSMKTVFAPLGTKDNARLRVAGIAELVGTNGAVRIARVEQLSEAAGRLFGYRFQPEPADIQPWIGFRPVTPTGIPIISGVGAFDNLFINAGQGALGFTHAFASADIVADLIKQTTLQGTQRTT